MAAANTRRVFVREVSDDHDTLSRICGADGSGRRCTERPLPNGRTAFVITAGLAEPRRSWRGSGPALVVIEFPTVEQARQCLLVDGNAKATPMRNAEPPPQSSGSPDSKICLIKPMIYPPSSTYVTILGGAGDTEIVTCFACLLPLGFHFPRQILFSLLAQELRRALAEYRIVR